MKKHFFGQLRLFKVISLALFTPLLFVSCGKNAEPVEQRHSTPDQITTPPGIRNELRPIVFPRDEGAHYEQPIEWWYLNAQLTDTAGKEYAFFFCVLSTGRHLLSIYDKAADKVQTKDYYESLNAEQNLLSLSSASLKWNQLTAPFHHRLAYQFEGLAVDLTIKANKKPFLPGGEGFITMGKNGTSHYYALTDLSISGSLGTGTELVNVTGTGWFDHQWGIWNWVEDFSQWKWFGVKLDNGVDLMLFNLYKDKQLIGSHCGYMDANGDQYHNLTCELVTKEYYQDAAGGKWQKVVELNIPSLANTVLTLTSEKDLQFVERHVLWEGSMKVSGTFKGVSVKGTAYGELNRPD